MTNNRDFTPNLPLWSFQVKPDSQLALKNRKDLEINLITRSLKDEDFKQELIANPKAVIEQELGTKLPEKLKINVLEETENTIYMVLPCNPYEGMSEEEVQAYLGMTYEDVAQWLLEQQKNVLLDKDSSIKLIAKAWKNEGFKNLLLLNAKEVIDREFSLGLLAKDVELNILEETKNSIYIVLVHADKQTYDTKLLQVSHDSSNLMLIAASCNANALINSCRN